jgi:hypothetical protein
LRSANRSNGGQEPTAGLSVSELDRTCFTGAWTTCSDMASPFFGRRRLTVAVHLVPVELRQPRTRIPASRHDPCVILMANVGFRQVYNALSFRGSGFVLMRPGGRGF